MRRRVSACLAALAFVVFAALSAMAQNWRPVGPPGGDVRTLAADPRDPRVVYLGASDGHIFGSRDAGGHWQLLGRVGNRLDSVVTSIVVDPRQSSVLYASTWTLGPDGGGVFGSNDGGRTWRVLGLAGQSVRALTQSPSNPDILVAGTLAGVFRSGDSGAAWQRISPEKDDELRNFDSVAMDPHNPEAIYAGTYHLAWKTTDAGRHWAPIHAGMIDDSDVMSIALDPSDPQRVFASACSGIYHSENAGALWTKFRGIPPTARRTHQIRQDPQRGQTLYAATTEGLWKTTNAGLTWTRVTPANWSISALLIDPKTTDRLLIGVEGSGVYVSEDGGKNFRAANTGFSHRQVVDVALDHDRPERMLVLLTNSVEPLLATADGGRTWLRLGAGPSPQQLRRVYAAPDGWWAALNSGGLLRYEPGKNAWVRVGAQPGNAAPARKRGARPMPARTAPTLRQVVNDIAFARDFWVAATEEGLLSSRDRGVTWAPLPAGLPVGSPVHSLRLSADGRQIRALSPRGLAVSRNGGKTWALLQLGFTARGRMRLYQADEDTLLVTSETGLFISRDAGQSWRPADLTERTIQDIAFAGDAWLIAAQKRGLYVSYDQGRKWARLEDPAAEGYFPALAAGASPMVLAASATEGLYTLELSGSAAVSTAAAPAGARPVPRQPQR